MRTELIERVKDEIADGSYETDAKLDVAADRALPDVVPINSLPEREASEMHAAHGTADLDAAGDELRGDAAA